MDPAATTADLERLLRRDEPAYEQARLDAIWNGRKTSRKPAAILRAREVAEVQAAVAWAAREGLQVSIRSGGHSWIANGVRDDTLLLDLSALDEVVIDALRRRAEVQPGARGHRLNELLDAEGLVFPTGHCPTVGVGGFLLGGGYGWNSRKLGPACFSVEAIDVVLADGTLVHADDESHPDLMWAARGAGPGFFGVVTRYYLRAHPAYREVLRSSMAFPEELRDEVLAWSYEVLPSTSSSLEIAGKTQHVPGIERPVTTLVGVGFVSDETPDEIFAAFESAPFRDRALTRVDRVPSDLAGLYAASEGFMPQGMRYAVDGVWTGAPIEAILEAGREIFETVPTPESFMFWMLWGGFPTRPEACWSTQAPLYFSPNSVWSDPADDLRLERWAHASLAAFADIDEGTQFSDANPGDRPAQGIDPEAATRIEELRAEYDPERRFVSYLSPEQSTTELGRHQRSA